jgi:hypothetical protein
MRFVPSSNERTSLSSRSIGPGRVFADRLVWDSSRSSSAAPLHRHDPVTFALSTVLPPLRIRDADSNRVRPRWFSQPRRFAPSRDSRACCIPLPIVGFDTFLPHSSGGAGPESPPIAGRVPCRSPHGGVLASRFVPPEGVPLSAAASCRHDRCLLGLFVHRRSAIFAPAPFPAPSFRSYRWDAVPRGLSPRRGPYLRTPCSDVRRPLLPGPCSPSRLPLADPCGSVDDWGALRLRHPHVRAPCAFVIVPSVVSPAFAGLVRRAPCRARFSCALATRLSSGARRLPRRAPRRTDEAAQGGRACVAHIVADASFASAGDRPGSVVADGPSISLPRAVFFRTPSMADAARRSAQSSELLCGGFVRVALASVSRPNRFVFVSRVGDPSFESEDEPDGRSSILRPHRGLRCGGWASHLPCGG